MASLILALQASSPLNLAWENTSQQLNWNLSSATSLANFLLLGILCAGWLWQLLRPQSTRRVAATACLLALFYLAGHLSGWALSAGPRFASAISGALSYSYFSFPWLGVVFAWIIVGMGWLHLQFLNEAWLLRTPRQQQSRMLILNIVGSSLITWFWLRSLLGYVSGSPDLLP